MTIKVTIYCYDSDFEIVKSANAVFNASVSTPYRFNAIFNTTPDALNDEVKFTRKFPKSGTYRVKIVYSETASGGIVDIGLDSPSGNNIFDGLNMQTGLTANVEAFTTIQISRGSHDISFFAQADGGASDYNMPFQILEFELIAEHEMLNSDPAPVNIGGKKLV